MELLSKKDCPFKRALNSKQVINQLNIMIKILLIIPYGRNWKQEDMYLKIKAEL